MPSSRCVLVGLLSTMMLCACSSAAWFESMQQAARNQCDNQPPAARSDCQAKLPKQTYDGFAKERAAY